MTDRQTDGERQTNVRFCSKFTDNADNNDYDYQNVDDIQTYI